MSARRCWCSVFGFMTSCNSHIACDNKQLKSPHENREVVHKLCLAAIVDGLGYDLFVVTRARCKIWHSKNLASERSPPNFRLPQSIKALRNEQNFQNTVELQSHLSPNQSTSAFSQSKTPYNFVCSQIQPPFFHMLVLSWSANRKA